MVMIQASITCAWHCTDVLLIHDTYITVLTSVHDKQLSPLWQRNRHAILMINFQVLNCLWIQSWLSNGLCWSMIDYKQDLVYNKVKQHVLYCISFKRSRANKKTMLKLCPIFEANIYLTFNLCTHSTPVYSMHDNLCWKWVTISKDVE